MTRSCPGAPRRKRHRAAVAAAWPTAAGSLFLSSAQQRKMVRLMLVPVSAVGDGEDREIV